MAPLNDNFADAIALTGTGTATVDNTDATTEVDEPNLDSAGRTFWYEWTAPGGSSALVVETLGTNSLATIVGLYTGSSVDALSQVAYGKGSACSPSYPYPTGAGGRPIRPMTAGEIQFLITVLNIAIAAGRWVAKLSDAVSDLSAYPPTYTYFDNDLIEACKEEVGRYSPGTRRREILITYLNIIDQRNLTTNAPLLEGDPAVVEVTGVMGGIYFLDADPGTVYYIQVGTHASTSPAGGSVRVNWSLSSGSGGGGAGSGGGGGGGGSGSGTGGGAGSGGFGTEFGGAVAERRWNAELLTKRADRLFDAPENAGPINQMLESKAGVFAVFAASRGAEWSRVFPWACHSRAELVELESFLARRRGRFVPFWSPTWSADLELMAVAEAGDKEIVVRASEFVQSEKHVAIITATGIYPFAIQGVTDNLNGTMTLRLWHDVTDPGLAEAIDPRSTLVSFLKYVRLAEDDIVIEFSAGAQIFCSLPLFEILSEMP